MRHRRGAGGVPEAPGAAASVGLCRRCRSRGHAARRGGRDRGRRDRASADALAPGRTTHATIVACVTGPRRPRPAAQAPPRPGLGDSDERCRADVAGGSAARRRAGPAGADRAAAPPRRSHGHWALEQHRHQHRRPATRLTPRPTACRSPRCVDPDNLNSRPGRPIRRHDRAVVDRRAVGDATPVSEHRRQSGDQRPRDYRHRPTGTTHEPGARHRRRARRLPPAPRRPHRHRVRRRHDTRDGTRPAQPGTGDGSATTSRTAALERRCTTTSTAAAEPDSRLDRRRRGHSAPPAVLALASQASSSGCTRSARRCHDERYLETLDHEELLRPSRTRARGCTRIVAVHSHGAGPVARRLPDVGLRRLARRGPRRAAPVARDDAQGRGRRPRPRAAARA